MNTYSKRFVKPKAKKPIRTIDEYLKAKKRFTEASFTPTDKHQIESTTEGFIIINNCKIPIKNGTLNMTQWTNRHEKPERVKLTEEQKKANRKASNKKQYDKRKLIVADIEEKPNMELTSINMPSIFRDFRPVKPIDDRPKRIITAKHLSIEQKPKVHYQQYKAKIGANIPIQQLLKTAKHLTEIGREKGNRLVSKKKNAMDETWKEFYIKSTQSNKSLYPYLDIVQKSKDAKKPLV